MHIRRRALTWQRYLYFRLHGRKTSNTAFIDVNVIYSKMSTIRRTVVKKRRLKSRTVLKSRRENKSVLWWSFAHYLAFVRRLFSTRSNAPHMFIHTMRHRRVTSCWECVLNAPHSLRGTHEIVCGAFLRFLSEWVTCEGPLCAKAKRYVIRFTLGL